MSQSDDSCAITSWQSIDELQRRAFDELYDALHCVYRTGKLFEIVQEKSWPSHIDWSVCPKIRQVQAISQHKGHEFDFAELINGSVDAILELFMAYDD